MGGDTEFENEPARGRGGGWSRARVFALGFLIGFVPLPLGMLIAGFLPGIRAATDILVVPGVILSLPFLNLVASPVWAIGCIAVFNGVAYGLVALLIRRWRR